MKRFLTGAVLVLAGVLGIARATDQAAIDPAKWGHYIQVVGRTASAGDGGYTLRWHWASPGRELVQEYLNPGDGKLAHREVIVPGEQPGTLLLTSSALGRKQWRGAIQADGRVLYIGKGLLKLPYVAGLAEDGTWQVLQVKLDGERIASTAPASNYNRFVISTGGGVDGADPSPVAVAAGAQSPQAGAERAPAPQPYKESEPERAAANATAPATESVTAPATAPAMAPASFGVMDAFVGGRYVYRNSVVTVTRGADGRSLVIALGNQIYELQETGDPGQYRGVRFPPNWSSVKAALKRNGDLLITANQRRSFSDPLGSTTLLHFSANQQGGFDLLEEWDPRGLRSVEFVGNNSYRPYSEQVAAQEAAYADGDRRRAAVQAREDAIARHESEARQSAQFAAMLGNLQQFGAEQARQQAQADAVVDRIHAQSQALQAQRDAEEAARMAQARAADAEHARQVREREEAERQAQAAQRQAAVASAAPVQPQASSVNGTAGRSANDVSSGGNAPFAGASTGASAAPGKTCTIPGVVGDWVYDQEETVETRLLTACGSAKPSVTKRVCEIGWCKVWFDCPAREVKCGASASEQ